MSETPRILKGVPSKYVTNDKVPLCVRVQDAVISGKMDDLGKPLRTDDCWNFEPPRTATYGCVVSKCVKICGQEGAPSSITLDVNQLVGPEGGFVPNQYVLPPAADLILQCGELASRVLSAEAATGQQG